MANIIYPTTEKIIEYNLLVLELIKVRKAGKAEVLNKSKITEVIRECEDTNGYEKIITHMTKLRNG